MATFAPSIGLNGDTTAPRTPSSDDIGGAQFHAFVDETPDASGQRSRYQSISCQEQYQSKSPEELRLEDYKQDRRYGASRIGKGTTCNNPFSTSSEELFSAKKRKTFPAYDEGRLVEENKHARARVEQTYAELDGMRKERMSELEKENAELRKESARQEKQIAALKEEKNALNEEVGKFAQYKKSVQELLDAGRKL
ncbi:unnamed protein product [Zymoseptoria tritici ST99CH_3D7]|uniref:Uncharacterized protein n=1 Tax=Zymoseptoria tritici (strain ST99CH_3D7) TaxID=1276538 RepID=A0A1X7RPN9_ZYMT9|nr:unnamed protein product [Zymoseptoria tritici ST99CH_3D7]